MTDPTALARPALTGERVVLCSPDGTAAGTASKAAVHHRYTPLHLAFSCYVFDLDGAVLLTRRARDKRTFPGLRTNSCCGHPAPEESMAVAVRRRLWQELGVSVAAVDLVLPRFRYRAVAADGTVENELCPVYRAVATGPRFHLDRSEVDAAWWVPWAELVAEATAAPLPDEGGVDDPLSHWASEQIGQLAALGPDPLTWPCGNPALLPPAATP